jgi:hypothetical protein
MATINADELDPFDVPPYSVAQCFGVFRHCNGIEVY